MKKFLLCLFMSAALLCTGALADSGYFDAEVTVQKEDDGSVLVTVADSPVLSEKRPRLRVAFDTEAEAVSVLHGGRVERAELEGGSVTFEVGEGGTYRLAAGNYALSETLRPGCTEAGEYTYSGEGLSYTEAIPALGHDFGEDGRLAACERCGERNPDYVPPAVLPELPPETDGEGPSEPEFTDVAAEVWYSDAVAYVYANGLMEGTSATTFEPDAGLTRAMFCAVLARMDGETVTGASWAETARAWAVESGVSDGADPNGRITREQLVTMLWRFAGEPTTDATLSGYSDAASVNSWAATAMAWAIDNGIITGVTSTTLVPQGAATRAQCAAILMRCGIAA